MSSRLFDGPTAVTRIYSSKIPALHLSDLNDDVLFEVFLNFVAIDWDGSFILTLICTKWRDIVISKPRLWTWIMIDDCQADWKERLDVCAFLSKSLPLQIVLRLPFSSEIPMNYLTSRCKTLIVETPFFKDNDWREKPIERILFHSVVSYFDFKGHRNGMIDMNSSLLGFLRDAPLERMEILSASKERAAFSYPKWQIYEGIMEGRPLKDLLAWNPSTLLTDLCFNTSDKTSVIVRLPDLWDLLPMLPHLNYLEISDTLVKWNRKETLPPISLQRLGTLVIDCPMNHWVFLSFEDDMWLGLFSILDSLSAPCLEVLSLCGSAHRILAAMARIKTGGIQPVELIAEISAFNEAIDIPTLDISHAWHRLRTFTICLPFPKKTYSRVSVDNATSIVRLLVSCLPETCSMRIFVGDGWHDFSLLGAPEFIVYSEYESEIEEHAHKERLSLASAIAYSRDALYFQSVYFTEYIEVENQQLAIKRLDLGDYYIVINSTFSSTWSLGNLRCSTYHIYLLVSEHPPGSLTLWNLRILTLYSDPEGRYTFSELSENIVEREMTFPRLTTLGLEFIDEWSPVIHIIGNLNKSTPQGGITELNLLGIPHPSILGELVAALQSGPSGYETDYFDRDTEDYGKEGTGCYFCFISRWKCFEGGECRRVSVDRMISITKDMDVADYSCLQMVVK